MDREALYRRALGIPELRFEGSWIWIDGGTLDLGLIRNSTLNSTNDFQVFGEVFEGKPFYAGGSSASGDGA